jgi:hypothetical protein
MRATITGKPASTHDMALRTAALSGHGLPKGSVESHFDDADWVDEVDGTAALLVGEPVAIINVVDCGVLSVVVGATISSVLLVLVIEVDSSASVCVASEVVEDVDAVVVVSSFLVAEVVIVVNALAVVDVGFSTVVEAAADLLSVLVSPVAGNFWTNSLAVSSAASMSSLGIAFPNSLHPSTMTSIKVESNCRSSGMQWKYMHCATRSRRLFSLADVHMHFTSFQAQPAPATHSVTHLSNLISTLEDLACVRAKVEAMASAAWALLEKNMVA